MDQIDTRTLRQIDTLMESAQAKLRSIKLAGLDIELYSQLLDARLELASAQGMLGYWTKQKEAA